MKSAIVTAVVVLCVATPAAAGFYTRVVTAQADPAVQSGIGLAEPSCDAHTRVGGGFDSHEEAGLAPLASTTEPASPIWTSVLLDYGDAPLSFKGAVVCSDSEPEPTIAEQSYPLTDFGGGSVLCPPGTVALSGGVGVIGDVLDSSTALLAPIFPSDPGGEALYERADGEAPAPGGWEALESVTVGSAVTASVFAVCLARANVTTIVESNVVGPLELGVETVFCPEGTTAVGGGFDAEERFAVRLVSSGPVFFGVPLPTRLADVSGGLAGPPIGWRVAVRNGHKFDERSFKAAAICVPEPGALASGAAALLVLALAAARRR